MSKIMPAINSLADILRGKRDLLLIIALMNVVYAFSYFQRVAIPGTIFDELQADMALSSSAVTMLGSIFLYVYGGMQAFSGALVDRIGPVRILLTGGTVLAAGSLLFPLSGTLTMLYVSRFIMGLGASLIYLSLVKQIDGHFNSKHFSILLSMTLFIGYSGGLLGTRPFEAAVQVFGWRKPLLAVGISSALAVIICAFVARRTAVSRRQPIDTHVFPALKRVLKNRDSCVGSYAVSIIFAIYMLVASVIGKKMLQDCCSLSSAAAASYTFLLVLFSVIAVSLSGLISRLAGNRRRLLLIFSAVMLLTSLCLAVPVLLGGAVWILPSFILLGASSMATPICCAYIKEVNDPAYAATSVGVYNGAAYLSVALLCNGAGVVLDCFGAGVKTTAFAVRYPPEAYGVILAGCFVLALSAFISVCFVRETYGNNVWSVSQEAFNRV
ncbi:MAG: MFS transporter [bacterium]|jgi:MFS family permease